MKRLIACLFLFTSLFALSQEKPTLSVLDLEASGLSEQETRLVTDYISSHIAEADLFRVVDRTQRETILNELKFSYSGCTSEDCQLEIGRLLAAAYIVVGSIGSVGDLYLLTLRLIEVETGETNKTKSAEYDDINTLIKSSRSLVFEFLRLASDESIEPGDDKAEKPPKDETANEEQKADGPERRLFWTMKTGGGAIAQTGISYFIIPKHLCIDAMTGLTYYSREYSSHNSFDGALWLITIDISAIVFDFIFTPYISAVALITTDFANVGFAPGVAIGFKIWEILVEGGVYFSLLKEDDSDIPAVRIGLGTRL